MKDRIVAIRKDKELTQSEFADKLNLTQSAVGSYEIGRRSLSDRTISDICRVFNVNEEWLRNGTGPMYRPAMGINNELAYEIGKIVNSDDEFVKNFILEFLKLSPELQSEVKNFIKNISKFV